MERVQGLSHCEQTAIELSSVPYENPSDALVAGVHDGNLYHMTQLSRNPTENLKPPRHRRQMRGTDLEALVTLYMPVIDLD